MDPRSRVQRPFLFELDDDHGDKSHGSFNGTSLNPGESDFLIICKGKEHKVAKETLSTKSNVLAAICKTHSSVTINCSENQTAISLISYINHGEYHVQDFILGIFPLQNPSKDLRTAISSIEARRDAHGLHRNHGVVGLSAMVAHHKLNWWIHVELYHLAVKYDIKGLQDLSAAKFRDQATKHKDSVELSSILDLGATIRDGLEP